MTEKRFTHKKWLDERQLFDGEKAFAIVDSGRQASIICNRLNKLSDENEQLKQTNQKLFDNLTECMSYKSLKNGEILILERENEQLKKELFEARKDYIMETYADNSVRRDEKLEQLKKELSE